MRILLSRAGRALHVAAAAAAPAAATALPVAAATAAPAGPVARAAPADEAPYIVTVRQDVDPAAVARMVGASPDHVYRTALRGFAARLNPGQVAALRGFPGVESVWEDGGVSPSGAAG
ncbi:protease inhibitor I9 family protein [Streptomyces sp. PCS3-D2]|uniref:protease inhibitor I9 family protein n=1 Tax=Streptomyces sp. PCS3-D2 TaxID=1460244 RepID=UPI0004467779|nr:protease inhibitor I9 family protein [Streptomyces sp. PCS3-D2]WKV73348.1 protease inhibitor I9 family protein [Streptomyces sp. PCS3-D2]